jgi:GNAT superfamily N-acetyltransferase
MRGGSTFTFRADNGLEVRTRQLCADDVPYLLAIFEKMTAHSRYLRFNEPLNDPDPDWLREQAARLADIPPDEGCGWLAFADLPGEPDAPVGGIRFIRLSEAVAEVSLVIRDDLQGLGIGTSLLDFASREAYARGYRKLVGVVQSVNLPLLRSLKRLGIPTTRQRDGSLIYIEADLDHLGLPDPPQAFIKDGV